MTTTQAPQDFLTTLATTHPDKLAVVEDLPDGTIRHWSYAEFEANACRLARVLIAEGVGAKDRVIWCGQNSLGWWRSWPLLASWGPLPCL